MINVGMIGFGGIAQAHKAAYKALVQQGKNVHLEAVCDIDPDRFQKNTKINIKTDNGLLDEDVHCYTDLDKMLASEQIDLIDICLPTPLHADMAIAMLKRGYHVLSEKPMSRNYIDCQRMLAAAEKAKGRLMIGQCLRFYPQYDYLKQCIDDGRYGRPRSAFFQRLSGPPVWGWNNWYMDYEKSGGCITDMHIHDIDMARYLFGEPKAVSCCTQDDISQSAIVHTRLYYDNLPVLAIGDWSLTGYNFQHKYSVGFEKASVVFENDQVSVYPKDGGTPFSPDIHPRDGIEGEIEYLIGLIETDSLNQKNPPQSAALSLKLIETMRSSAEQGGVTLPFNGALL